MSISDLYEVLGRLFDAQEENQVLLEFNTSSKLVIDLIASSVDLEEEIIELPDPSLSTSLTDQPTKKVQPVNVTVQKNIRKSPTKIPDFSPPSRDIQKIQPVAAQGNVERSFPHFLPPSWNNPTMTTTQLEDNRGSASTSSQAIEPLPESVITTALHHVISADKSPETSENTHDLGSGLPQAAAKLEHTPDPGPDTSTTRVRKRPQASTSHGSLTTEAPSVEEASDQERIPNSKRPRMEKTVTKMSSKKRGRKAGITKQPKPPTGTAATTEEKSEPVKVPKAKKEPLPARETSKR